MGHKSQKRRLSEGRKKRERSNQIFRLSPGKQESRFSLFLSSARLALLSGLAMAVSTVAQAQDASAPPVDPRDARIEELEQRLAALESLMAEKPHQAVEPDHSSFRPQSAVSRLSESAPAPRLIRVSATAAPAAPAPEQAAVSGGASRTTVIDTLAAERALERTLIRGGAMLLPPGQIELEPSIGFATVENDLPILIQSFDGGVETGLVRQRRQDGNARLAARIGLPAGFQLEAVAGADFAREQERLSIAGVPSGSQSREGAAISDIGIGLARTLYRSNSSAWDLVGRVSYNSRSGKHQDGAVAFGNGFEEISAGLTGVARQDPLVFVAGVNYSTALERDGIEPGDRIGVNTAVVLAVSPETSLRFGASLSQSDVLSVNGSPLEGTDTLGASLQLGVTSLVARGRLVDVGIEVGLTDDVPAFALSASMPLRLPSWR